MVAEGYYDGVVDNLGLIISKWDLIIKYLIKFKSYFKWLIFEKNN